MGYGCELKTKTSKLVEYRPSPVTLNIETKERKKTPESGIIIQ